MVFLKEFQLGEFSETTPREEELLLSLLRELDPQLVGINLTTSFTADLGYRIADKIRASLGVPVIFGGTHVSALPEECLEHADFVCLGEGDEAIVELADALAEGKPVDGIANIWRRVNGGIRRNEVRPLVQDLDLFPAPSYGEPECYYIDGDQVHKVDQAARYDMYQTTASRMCCPFNCAFCAGVWLRRGLYANKGKVCRYRSVSRVLEEIQQALRVNPRIRLVRFWDEIFGTGAPRGWLDEFCERYPREIGVPFEIWYHPAVVTDDRIRKLKGAGLACAWMGIESGSPKVRREVLNRRETNQLILRSAEILGRHRVEVGYDFLLDIPWMTLENCRATFELIMRLPRPFSVHLHSLSLLPRAALTERALAEGLIRREQVALADRPIVDRFASHLWQYRLEIRSRQAAFWHSLIYLAGLPFLPRPLLWKLYRLRPLLELFPGGLVLAAQLARTKERTGRPNYLAALTNVYPALGRLLAGHPRLRLATGSLLRRLGRILPVRG
jgi:radical SAM superfamily enzyme YgiQ (UPF0313 family)